MSERFNGTSIAESHVGSAAAESLDQLQVEATLNPEAANAIAIDLQVKDACGQNLAESVRLEMRLFEPTMIEALAAAYTCAETGAGTEVSTTAQAALVVDTDVNGQAQITVTDASGTSTDTIFAKTKVMNRPSRTTLTEVEFA